ncbi:MAG: hypothetical protein R3E39_13315 [Anaerolineae bacterium]
MRRLSLLFILAMLIMGVFIIPVSAASNSGVSFTLGCDGFSGSGEITLNRDNTGSLREAFVVVATDGIGNIIYKPVVDSFFVGGTVSWQAGNVINWTSAPVYNPLTLRVVSQSGNDFAEQTVALATGNCDGLLTYGVLPFELNGLTSPTVGLNDTPPRPTNPEVITQVLPGFLVVNTDNLSLRSGDGVEFTQVGVVDGGTKLIPLGRNLKFTWWLVQVDDIVGWAKAEFLIARGDLTGIPVVESQGEVAPPTIFVFSNTTLLSSPESGALPLCNISGNLDYLAVGRTKNIEWFEVQATCDNALVRGWLPASQGAFRSQTGAPLPITG